MRRPVLAALLLLSILVAVLFVAQAQPVSADGFELPDERHVGNDFDKLWSKHEFGEPSAGWRDASLNEYLTHSSDYFYVDPPDAPEEWNTGEVEQNEVGENDTVSLHPTTAELESGDILRDTYLKVFDVSPSTKVWSHEEDTFGDDIDDDTLLVSGDSVVRGFLDYRLVGTTDEPDVYLFVFDSNRDFSNVTLDEAEKTIEPGSFSLRIDESEELRTGSGEFTVGARLIAGDEELVNLLEDINSLLGDVRNLRSTGVEDIDGDDVGEVVSELLRIENEVENLDVSIEFSTPEPPDPENAGSDALMSYLGDAESALESLGSEIETLGGQEVIEVTDSIEIEVYDTLSIGDVGGGSGDDEPTPPGFIAGTGFPVLYPDGYSGFLLQFIPPANGERWSSVELPDGSTVQSEWRFFSARDTDWDDWRLAGATDEAETYHPVQVHAVPSRSGIFVDGDAEISDAFGEPTEPPEIPDKVSVDVPNSTYLPSQTVELRYNATGTSELSGLVRGTSADIQPVGAGPWTVRESSLSVSVIERHDGFVTLGIRLRDSQGNPIDTRLGDDRIDISGHGNVTTGLDGTATVNITYPQSGTVVVEYIPQGVTDAAAGGGAADDRILYLGDKDMVHIEGDFDLFEELTLLLRLGFFILPFLILVFMLDRMLGLGIWPPWRGI